MSSILIVGCGYLGARVAQRLVERGKRVLGTTRSPERAAALAARGIETILLDVLDPGSLDRLPAAERAVLCVGYDRRSGAPRSNVGVIGLEGVVRYLAASGLRGLVYTGSVSVYGQAGGVWVDETSATEPATETGRVQVAAESTLRQAFPGLITLRLGGLYGPGRVIHRESLVRGLPLEGNPDRWLNLIHVDDAARAVVAALNAEAPPRIVNVCDDRPVSRRNYVETTARLLGVAPPVWRPTDDPIEPNRRVSNTRLKAALLTALDHPTIEQGLPAALADS
jgi:nucleoside-diphosphate-sugar epimerase